MLVHPHRRPRQQVQVPLTALIDMVFLLLIYFLLTTNFVVEEGITVKLPKAKAASPRISNVLTVTINRDGIFFVGAEELPEEELLNHLRTQLDRRADKLVVVKADSAVFLDRAVKALDLAKEAGAERLSLATEKDL